MSIAAGKLRHRVRIEQYVLDTDSNGDVAQDPNTGATSGTWQEFATVWAEIAPLSAKEFIAAQSVQSQVITRITIRYRPGLDATMRLVHMVGADVRGPVYNIAGVLPDLDSGLEYLTLPCSQGVSADGQGTSPGGRAPTK